MDTQSLSKFLSSSHITHVNKKIEITSLYNIINIANLGLAIEGCTNLQNLELHFRSWCYLRDQNACQLIKALDSCKKLSTLILDLRILKLGTDNLIKCLASALANSPNVQALSFKIYEKRIKDIHAFQIASIIVRCAKLQSLELQFHQCPLGDKAVLELRYCIQQCTNLSKLTLDFRQSKIEEKGILNISSLVAGLYNIQTLHLQLSQCISQQGSQGLSSLFKRFSPNLTTLVLNLSNNFITDNAILDLALAVGLCIHLNLFSIDLCKNRIKGQNVINLCSELQKCTKLTHLELHLKSNLIDSKDLFDLGCQLAMLNISSLVLQTSVDDESVDLLSSSLQNLKNLSKLIFYLQKNKISEKGMKNLGSQLAKCTNLSNLALNISYNRIRNNGLFDLGNSLSSLNKLTYLQILLFQRQYDDEEVFLQFSKAFLNCSNLRYLEICFPYYINQKKDLMRKFKNKAQKMKRIVKFII